MACKKVISCVAAFALFAFIAMAPCAAWAQNAIFKAQVMKSKEAYRYGLYEQAAAYGKRAISVAEETFGATNPNVASAMNNLAFIYHAQGKYPESEALYKSAIAIWRLVFRASHPNIAVALNNLAELYRVQNRFDRAEELYKACIQIKEQELGSDDVSLLAPLNNLAELYAQKSQYSDAIILSEAALRIAEKSPCPPLAYLKTIQENLSDWYLKTGAEGLAKDLRAKASALSSAGN